MEWDVFISHASEDKAAFVRPLADRLKERGLRVWFDEFTLAVGDSLRRSIDRGLASSRFGIVVISQNFLLKEWPQKELDGLVAREVDGVKVILPVWHNISAKEIRSYSPLLADRLGVSPERGLDHVVEKLIDAIRRDHLSEATEPGAVRRRFATDIPRDTSKIELGTAVSRAKELMADPRSEIILHDFISSCCQESLTELQDNKVLDGEGPFSKEEFQRRIIAFEKASSIPAALFALASYWNSSNRGFEIAFGRFLTLAQTRGAGHVYCHQLKRYPALATLFAAGIAGQLSGHWALFGKMSGAMIAGTLNTSDSPLSDLLWSFSPFETLSSSLPTQATLDWLGVQRHPAGSERIFSLLSPLLGQYISNEEALIYAFDRFEYLLSLIHADFRLQYEKQTGREFLLWMPPGSYIYRGRYQYAPGMYLGSLGTKPASSVVASLNSEITDQAKQWPPLSAGLFGGSSERAAAAVGFAKRFFAENKISF